jgi:hypothetical protein
MAYTPINLGDILQQAGQIKAQQQRQQMGDLQLQEAQRQQSDQQGIDQAIQANPNASLGDLAGKFGMAGVKASGDLNQARAADLTSRYRQLFTAANQVANSDDPIGTVHQVAPGFAQQYDQAHGQGAFDRLTPEQVKQQAGDVAQQALAGLVDPDKQFQAHQAMIQAHYKQEGPGGEAARNAATIAGQAQQGNLNRAVTMRGQDLEQGRANKPQLVTVKNPDGTETQKWVQPGQTGGPALGPPSQKPLGEADKKNAVLFDSMMNAEKQIQALTAQKGGATDTSSKWNAFLGGLPVVGGVAKVAQTDEYRKYESAGLRWAANLLYLKSGATANPDEIRSTWKQFFPQPGDGADVKAQKEQARQQEIESTRKYMVPNAAPLNAGKVVNFSDLPQ